jgi:hypothetical protein
MVPLRWLAVLQQPRLPRLRRAPPAFVMALMHGVSAADQRAFA